MNSNFIDQSRFKKITIFFKDDYTVKNDIVIKLTDELKQILIDDHQNVSNNNKLLNLPASNTVETILDDYKTFKIEKQFDKFALCFLNNFQ